LQIHNVLEEASESRKLRFAELPFGAQLLLISTRIEPEFESQKQRLYVSIRIL